MPGGVAAWDQQPSPSRAGTCAPKCALIQSLSDSMVDTSSTAQREYSAGAFHTQIEGQCRGRSSYVVVQCPETLSPFFVAPDELTVAEVDRAMDNLAKSGKLGFSQGPSRRESMPMMGGPAPFNDFGMSSIYLTLHRFVKLTDSASTPYGRNGNASSFN